jgi:hypothetical protein
LLYWQIQGVIFDALVQTSCKTNYKYQNTDIEFSIRAKMCQSLKDIFVERLWRTVKYENIYMNEYQTVPELRSGLKRYFEFYTGAYPIRSVCE